MVYLIIKIKKLHYSIYTYMKQKSLIELSTILLVII